MPAPAAVAPFDRAALLDALRAAELLSPAQFSRAVGATRSGSAADAAAALVAAGLLTRFQADRLLSGRTDGFLLGPYFVLEQVGRGSLSRVYKAKHRTMQRTVAIKVLATELTVTPARRDAVRSAVRAVGGLTHPNIVTAYDANELHDRFYLVLEFVDGPDLGALVRARGPLPLGEACEFVRQIAAGLQHAHERGMVHLDLKPSNLLVSRPTSGAGATIKITDFGLPKAPGAVGDFAAPEVSATVSPAAALTAGAAGCARSSTGAAPALTAGAAGCARSSTGAAPALTAGAGCARSSTGAAPALSGSHRADLYSLGRVFHFMLTGRAGRDVLPLAQLRPDVPTDVAAIVHKLLARNPGDRFASAAELLLHLDSVCVPTALPVDGAVNFDLPGYPVYPGHDSGFLTGRQSLPVATDASPWAEITATAATAGDTMPLNRDDTPRPPPYRSKAPRRGESVPLWMTATMLVSFVLLSLMGIGVVVKSLVK